MIREIKKLFLYSSLISKVGNSSLFGEQMISYVYFPTDLFAIPQRILIKIKRLFNSDSCVEKLTGLLIWTVFPICSHLEPLSAFVIKQADTCIMHLHIHNGTHWDYNIVLSDVFLLPYDIPWYSATMVHILLGCRSKTVDSVDVCQNNGPINHNFSSQSLALPGAIVP